MKKRIPRKPMAHNPIGTYLAARRAAGRHRIAAQNASLYSLLNHSCNFIREATVVFPRNTKEEVIMFGLIARAPGNCVQALGVGPTIINSLLQKAMKMNEVAAEVIKRAAACPLNHLIRNWRVRER